MQAESAEIWQKSMAGVIQNIVQRSAVAFNMSVVEGVAIKPPTLHIKHIKLSLMFRAEMFSKYRQHFIHGKVHAFKRNAGHVAITLKNRHVIFIRHGIDAGLLQCRVKIIVHRVHMPVNLEQRGSVHGFSAMSPAVAGGWGVTASAAGRVST